MRRLLGSLIAGAILLAACGSGSDLPDASDLPREGVTSSSSPETTPDSGSIEWEDCGGGFECGELSVPLDHLDPDGEMISLGLIRLQAGDPGRRIGSLVVNPGGPGASGVELAEQAPAIFGSDILDRFDVVGFDPRGVGQSAAVECDDDLDSFFAVDTTPDDTEELEELRTAARDYAESCEEQSGELLAHISTENTARDMDLIREALGEEKLTYLGFSYGTYLGALYAELYPENVRAFVLDGAVDPTLSDEESAIEQSLGFETQFEEFLDTCASERSCRFHSDGDPEAAYDALMQRIDDEGIEGSDGRVLGPGEADIAVVTSLYDGRQGFTVLADALAAAEDGDADPLLALFDLYVGRDPAGNFDGAQASFLGIGCVDGSDRLSAEEHDALAETVGEAAPRFGESGVNLGYACVYWPADPVGRDGPVRATGAPPILVIGTRGDPATPPQWAESLADQLDSGVLLRLDARGHLAYGDGHECIDDLVDDYLITLTVPDDGTTCDP